MLLLAANAANDATPCGLAHTFPRIPFAYHPHAIPWYGYRAHTHRQDLQPDGFATRELALANYG